MDSNFADLHSFDAQRRALIEQIREREALIDQIASQGLLPFLNHVVIDSSPEPRHFRELANPWQWALVKRFAGAIEDVAGAPSAGAYAGPRNFWLTLPRGHDKTGLIGRTAAWALAYSRKSLQVTTAATDKDQAALIIDSMAREAALNPWFGRRLKFHNYTVTNVKTGSHLEALASDAGSSMGGKPHLLIFDELTWWAKRDLWDALSSGIIKRPGAIQMVITNAGILRSWQHDELMKARRAPGRWYVYEAPGPIASWMTPERVREEADKLLPRMANRVFFNKWLDPSDASGWVSRSEAQACEDLGRQMCLGYKLKGLPDRRYVVAVDYGPSRDRTVIVVVHKEAAREDAPERIVVDRMDVLQGSKSQHVPIARVEELLDEIIRDFNVAKVVVDRYQMESTLQRFSRKVTVAPFEYRGTKTNYELAQTLRSAVVNLELAWYPGAGDIYVDKSGSVSTLVDEFASVSTKETASGYRIYNSPGTHDDRVVALGMGLLALIKLEEKRELFLSDLWF